MSTVTGVRREPRWSVRVGAADADVVLVAVGAQGSGVAVATDAGDLAWVEVASGKVADRVEAALDVPTDLAVHPTRPVVAVAGVLGHARWEVGGALRRHTGHWGAAVAFGADGRLAAAVGRRLAVYTDSEVPEPTYLSDPAASTITGLAWTPRGGRVAVSAYGGVQVFDTVGSAPVRVHRYAGSHLAVAVNPTGRWICSGNQDASVHIWRTADDDELEMAGYPDKVTRVAFDATGRWFANNGAPEVTVWDFLGKGPRGRAPHLLVGHEGVGDLAWRPGPGSVLASVGTEGGVRVWSMAGAGAAGRTQPPRRHPVLTLPLDDALGLSWLGPDALVVARRGGYVDLWSVSG